MKWRRPSRLLAAALLAALTGCGSLLPPRGTPPELYTLTAATGLTPGQPRVSRQILVETPVAPAALDTARIELSPTPTTVDYFADAAWIDRAPLMVQSLLVESLENSGRITAVGRESLGLRADYIMMPELRHFEADYGGSREGPPVVRVQINVKLVKLPERAIIAQRTLEATAVAARNDVPAVVDAFNVASHDAMSQIVLWTLDSAGR